jgi:hypothetical protein
MSGSARLALPLLSVGQAQKEFTVNEAFQTLDLLVAGMVEEPPLATPPATPSLGACYIVAEDATDAWAGKSQCVAGWTSGGWRFVAPFEGLPVHVRSTGTCAMFRGGAWEIGQVRGAALVIGNEQVVGSRAAAIASPAGGATIDSGARAAIDAILGALRGHGLIGI